MTLPNNFKLFCFNSFNLITSNFTPTLPRKKVVHKANMTNIEKMLNCKP